MNIHEAKKLAEVYIEKYAPKIKGDSYVVVMDATIDTEEGWYFCYQSSKYVKTRDMNFFIVGTPPILISKDGTVIGPANPKKQI